MTRCSRPRVLALVMAVCSLLAAACSGTSTTQPSASAQPSRVAQLRLAGFGAGNYGYPTPYASIRGPGKLLAAYIFDQLTNPDATGIEKPWLAKSWKISPDGVTWTFTLQSHPVFSDGTPLTTDDVLFSFKYVMRGGPGNKAAPAPNAIASVTAPDASTIVIQLNRPDPTFLDEVGGTFGVSIVPRHIWSAVTDPAHFQGTTALIGSGPYMLTSFDLTAGAYQYTANDKFYLGPPVVQELTYAALPSTADPLVSLAHGDLDAASAPNSNGGVPQSEFTSLQSKYTLLTSPGEYNVALHFNLAKGFPYNSQTFRQAVAYAINRQDMLKRLVAGRGVPGSVGGLGPDNPWLDTKLPAYNFDPNKAKAMLTQIGLVDTDGDGIRNLPNGGADLHIPLIVSSTDVNEAQLVSEYLRAVGIAVDIQSVDQATMDAGATAGHYSMAVIHYGGLGSDPYTRICASYSSVTKGAFSFTRAQGYSNATVDSLCTQIGVTVNHATRQGLVNQLQSIINMDVPLMPLYIPDQLTFVNSMSFKAWAYTPGCPPCGATSNKLMLATGRTTESSP